MLFTAGPQGNGLQWKTDGGKNPNASKGAAVGDEQRPEMTQLDRRIYRLPNFRFQISEFQMHRENSLVISKYFDCSSFLAPLNGLCIKI